MTVLSWNCRGLAAAPTFRELKNLCKIYRPAIIFLMETRAPEERVERVRRRLKYKNMFCVEAIGRSGGLCLFWNDEVQLQIFHSSQNFIHTSILLNASGSLFDCSFIYGNPTFRQRRGLWTRILRFQQDRSSPWCCLGDFNELLSHFEKEGVRPHFPGRAEIFRDFLNTSGLMDFDLKGCSFTWASNPRNGIVTREKLDRILMNWPCRQMFPNAIGTALPAITSDHSPILLHIFPKERSGKSFNYEVFWDEHSECSDIVHLGWHCIPCCDDPWDTINRRTKRCQQGLLTWQNKTFRNADEEIKVLQTKLKALMSQQGEDVIWAEIKSVQKRIDDLWQQEEVFWSQRSRLKWLEGGDKNTKFFHATTVQRRAKNRIQRIRNDRGDWVEGKEAIFSTILEHFDDVYKSDGPQSGENICSFIPKLVTSQMNDKLLAPITLAEVRFAVFNMGPLKAPGPDGLNGLFFQKNWESVGEDVFKAIVEFFSKGKLPENINETSVTLIPKIPLPESINHLRPISCCNFIYKIISKLMVLRMKGFMDLLVSPNQSAFVGGRLIQDNLIVAHEIVEVRTILW